MTIATILIATWFQERRSRLIHINCPLKTKVTWTFRLSFRYQITTQPWRKIARTTKQICTPLKRENQTFLTLRERVRGSTSKRSHIEWTKSTGSAKTHICDRVPKKPKTTITWTTFSTSQMERALATSECSSSSFKNHQH